MLDPDEEGASRLVHRIEEYALTFTSTANLFHDEDWEEFFSAQRCVVHRNLQYANMTI